VGQYPRIFFQCVAVDITILLNAFNEARGNIFLHLSGTGRIQQIPRSLLDVLLAGFK
jgi:hypothetical protein